MKIALASDHAGLLLKDKIKEYLLANNYQVLDLGTNSLDSVDYPFYGKKLGEAVTDSKKDINFGIGFCGTGIGIGIAANKINGVRAALVYDENTARLAKEHNDANIITLGGRTTSIDDAIKIINAFINAKFDTNNIRHEKRINEIHTIEKEEKHE
ncbi:ribose 5-phosphate isomerase B [Acholeplasma sp. OttesenSCG-928-E16]|nr:ribose 5-phosphate isomerase B [Acholeplasma sp. OttesenSCG-928-E16]